MPLRVRLRTSTWRALYVEFAILVSRPEYSNSGFGKKLKLSGSTPVCWYDCARVPSSPVTKELEDVAFVSKPLPGSVLKNGVGLLPVIDGLYVGLNFPVAQ